MTPEQIREIVKITLDELTQRKLRRAIKKLDGSILTVVPELIPMLEEVEFIKMLLDKVGGYHGQSLKDLVHELLMAYAFNDQTMNIYSQIGIIMLIGLVAKNGILIVEFANQKQEAGVDKMIAIREASIQRLRPILMTSVSTILGLVPLVFATGEGANGRIAMGISVVGGMLISTLLTMFIVPAVYTYISTNRINKK